MKNKQDIFLGMFINNYVEIVQDFEVTTQFQATPDGEHLQEVRMPMTVSGVVMDSDGEFLYLSRDGEDVDQALPIHTIKHIGIVPQSDPIMDALDQAEPDGNTFN